MWFLGLCIHNGDSTLDQIARRDEFDSEDMTHVLISSNDKLRHGEPHAFGKVAGQYVAKIACMKSESAWLLLAVEAPGTVLGYGQGGKWCSGKY